MYSVPVYYCTYPNRHPHCIPAPRTQALKLSHTALGGTSPGKVVNLLSNDVNRFDLVTLLFNCFWTGPVLTIIIGILLWHEIGWAAVIGIAIAVSVVPLQSKWTRPDII